MVLLVLIPADNITDGHSVPNGDNRMHSWTYSYDRTRPGPRDKVPDLLIILGRRWLYFEADYCLSTTEVHTRAAASDSEAVRPVNS